MKQTVKQKWIRELEIDFPEHREVIEQLSRTVDLMMELARDYYFCKHQIRILDKIGRNQLSHQYAKALEALESELVHLLKNYTTIKS